MTNHNGHNGNGFGAMDFLRGLVFGGLAGATVAILFAPRSGEETRELIRERSDELRGRVSQTALETREQISDFAHRVQRQSGELAHEVASGAEALQQRGRDYLLNQQGRVERTAGAARQAVEESWQEAA